MPKPVKKTNTYNHTTRFFVNVYRITKEDYCSTSTAQTTCCMQILTSDETHCAS